MVEERGVCSVCGGDCNPMSQVCGVCARNGALENQIQHAYLEFKRREDEENKQIENKENVNEEKVRDLENRLRLTLIEAVANLNNVSGSPANRILALVRFCSDLIHRIKTIRRRLIHNTR